MRKQALLLFTAIMIVSFTACAAPAAVSVTPSATPVAVDDIEQPKGPQIGVSLAGEGGFYEQLSAEISAACASYGYEVSVVSADTGDKQKADIQAFLSAGVSVMVIDPVDVDVLETALAECDTDGVPVINIIDSINGMVSTLISPDYIEVGKAAGARAMALYGETGGACLELKTDYDSFIMQLKSDGFRTALGKDGKVTVAAEKYCGTDEEMAYESVKAELGLGNVSFIFAHSATLAHGAIRAIGESGKDVSLVVYGADQEIMDALSSGVVDMALFIDPAQTAKLAITDADGFIKNSDYVPAQYQPLTVYAVTAENVAQYYTADNAYAKAPAQ